MRVIRSSLAIAAALLAGLGPVVTEAPRVEPLAPPPPRRVPPSRKRFGEGRSTLKKTLRPRPRPVYGEHHDPRSGFVGAKLRRKAAEGKL
jgi:hypothetical protein